MPDMMTEIDVANTVAETFTELYRDKITDPDWKNVSWIPAKIGKTLPYAGMAVHFATADNGERLAAASSAGIGAFIGQVVGMAIGNLFGGEQHPSAWAKVYYDAITHHYRANAYGKMVCWV